MPPFAGSVSHRSRVATGLPNYDFEMAWPKRRRLFLVENLLFLGCLVVGLVLVFMVSTVGGKIIVAGCLAAIMCLHGVLALTYFHDVRSEMREERERRRSEGSFHG